MVFKPIYILILAFTIVIDYIAGIYIEKTVGFKRRLFLIISLLANIGILAFFKYYNFLIENISCLLNSLSIPNQFSFLSILLPVGLSFHTFQALSYTIEIYRGNQKAERNFGIYALYVMFYPQLVAGPIERPQNMLHQFHSKHNFNYDEVVYGLKIMLWGFFKKIVIADRLAIYVNAVYGNPLQHNGSSLLLATFFFAIQIYCDFSGYSDIAIGSARIMGFKLMQNFKRPYLATSVSDFWKRWHISLSTWFRDYIYISLGGNKVSIPRIYLNLFVVFLLSGLWHGASWTFVIWGCINALFIIISLIVKNNKTYFFLHMIIPDKLKIFFQILITFFLISFSWIFFRSDSLTSSMLIVKKIFSKWKGSLYYENPSMLLYSFFGIFVLFLYELNKEYIINSYTLFNNKNWIIRNLPYALLVILILLFGVFDGGQFIYFQF
jgi:D-alanyl-lipoteichoic acid acyltransferase DltB (MBOAT superfamily)